MKNTQYAQIVNSVKNINGNEGCLKIELYFKQFKEMTISWDNRRCFDLLLSHLIGHARIIFKDVSGHRKNNYDEINVIK